MKGIEKCCMQISAIKLTEYCISKSCVQNFNWKQRRYRITNEPTTNWVGNVMNYIEPEFNNLVRCCFKYIFQVNRTTGWRKDCINGIFNRSIWRYWKQLREKKDRLTLRNKLRHSLNSLNKRWLKLYTIEIFCFFIRFNTFYDSQTQLKQMFFYFTT